MADKQVRIDLTANDKASEKIRDVADEAKDLEKLDPEVEVAADTTKAERNVEDLEDDLKDLARKDTEVVLKARISDAKGALKELEGNLDTTRETAERTEKAVDDIGRAQGPRLAGNTVADMTGPLGEASGAASDLGGVFDGLGDTAESAFLKMGGSEAGGAAIASALGGIGFAVAGAAAAWSYFSGKAKKAAEDQKKLIDNQKSLIEALKEGNSVAAASKFEETYSDALRAAEKLGYTVEEGTEIISGQSDAVGDLDEHYLAAKETLADYAAQSKDTVRTAEDWKKIGVAQEFVNLHDTLTAGQQQWDDLNGSFATAEDRSAAVARGLDGITSSSGKTSRATEKLTRDQEYQERQTKKLDEAYDRLRGAVDFGRAMETFSADFQAAHDKAVAGTKLTSDEIDSLEDDIFDVAEYAKLNPVEVKSLLDRIAAGDYLGVKTDVEAYAAAHPPGVPTVLKQPTDAELRAYIDATRRRLSAAAAARGLASGVPGIPSMAAAATSTVNVYQTVPRGYHGDLLTDARSAAKRAGGLYQRNRTGVMARTGDTALPSLSPPGGHTFSEAASHLHIGLERLPQAAYTWDDADPDVTWADPYLVPTVGTVTTPDPGPLPADCTFVFRVRPTAATGQAVVSQFEVAPGYSWTLVVSPDQETLFWVPSANGTNFTLHGVNIGAFTGADEWYALAVSTTGGVQGFRSTDRVTWTPTQTTPGPLPTTFDASSVMRVGSDGFGETFFGRIYSVELRTGLDPSAGSVLWRFDAADYPGTGTTYTDPRGRAWTLTSAAAIVATPERVWDAPFIGGGLTHSTCDFIACTIDMGHPDEDGLFGPGQAVITLANPTGEYSTRSADGRLTYMAIGRQVQILGEADNLTWWLFNGRVAAWDENTDGTVTITAYDGFAQLSQDVATEWTPGNFGQTASQRINSICSKWGYVGPKNLALTETRLHNIATDRTPLEESQVAAMSDGGVLFCDSDGRLTYQGRDWTLGRPVQPTTPLTISDNICDGPINVWDLAILTTDDALASEVRIENWEDPPKTAVATLTPSLWDQPYVWTMPEPNLWTEQADGDRLATDLLARYANDTARFTFTLHLLDPNQDLWRAGIDLRLGDKINVVRTFPAAGGDEGYLDVDNLVGSITHEITPDSWLVTIETSRVFAYRQPLRWDAAPYRWDDPNNLNVWSM